MTVLIYAFMLTSRVNRYVTAETIIPTFICLLIFTMVLLMGRMMKLVDLVINKGVSIGDIFILFGTLIPTFLNLTLPLAFLMGIMIGLSRMSADSETIAMKSAGIGLGQIARPVISMAIIFSLLTGVAGLWLKPWGYNAFRNQVFDITMQRATVGFQEQVFMRQFDNLVLYAEEIDGRSGVMSGLYLVEKNRDTSTVIFADYGTVFTDDSSGSVSFQLRNGTIHQLQENDESSYQLIHFQNYSVQPDIAGQGNLAEQKRSRNLKTKELPTTELWSRISQFNDPKGIGKLSSMRSELHSRLVSPLTPLIFALFALPFSIQSHRSGRSGGFAIGLIIYLCYYTILSLAKTLTAEAGLSPIVSFWLPHALLIATGAYCLKQSANEEPSIIILWLEQTFTFVRSRLKKLDEYS